MDHYDDFHINKSNKKYTSIKDISERTQKSINVKFKNNRYSSI